MKTSLRVKLKEMIRMQGYLSYNDIELNCKNGKFGKWYKVATATRRMNELTEPKHHAYDPNIQTDYKNGIVIGYRWVGKPVQYQTYKVEGMDKIIKIPIK